MRPSSDGRGKARDGAWPLGVRHRGRRAPSLNLGLAPRRLAAMKTALRLAALLLLAAPATSFAQLEIRLGFPAPPPLVVVSPGIQVVPNHAEEVFFTGGFYWLRRDGHWFRAREHNAAWVQVQPAIVPAALVRIPPGQYRHYRAEMREERREERHERREERRERREERHERRHGHD